METLYPTGSNLLFNLIMYKTAVTSLLEAESEASPCFKDPDKYGLGTTTLTMECTSHSSTKRALSVLMLEMELTSLCKSVLMVPVKDGKSQLYKHDLLEFKC